MSKDYTKRVKELAAHYKVERGSKSLPEWLKAIKKAAGHEFMGMEELYALTFKPKGAKESAASEKKDDGAKPAASGVVEVVHAEEVVRPAPQHQRIEVGAPTIQVHSPPVVVHAPSVRDLRLVDIAHRAITNAFVFGSGVMLGLLLAGSSHLPRLALW